MTLTPQDAPDMLRTQLVASVAMLRAVQSSVHCARRSNWHFIWCKRMAEQFPLSAGFYNAMAARTKRAALSHLNDARQWRDQAAA